VVNQLTFTDYEQKETSSKTKQNLLKLTSLVTDKPKEAQRGERGESNWRNIETIWVCIMSLKVGGFAHL